MGLRLENVIDYAIKNGLEYECYTNVLDRWGDAINPETWVGLELKPNIWYWWACNTRELNLETYDWEYREDYELFFQHRYNRVNGAKQSSYKKREEAEILILKNVA